MKKNTILILFIIIAGLIMLINLPRAAAPIHVGGDSRPTDFSEIGTFVMNIPTQDEADLPRLVYEKPGYPALTKKLLFDELSVCQAISCMAMSVTLDVPFGGQRISLEGILMEDNKVLVRKLRRLSENEPVFTPPVGKVFISWVAARELIKGCKVSSLFQMHSLDVELVLKDGNKYQTVEPVIDEVFRVLEEGGNKCGDITVATE